MSLYCVKCLIFTKNRNVKIKCKIDVKNNLYCRCIDCGSKNLETTDEEELCYLLKGLI